MLLTNQKFGLGLSNRIDLWCSVTKIETDGIEFRVINGGWDGFWKPNGDVIVYGPGPERTVHKAIKYHLDPIPNFKRENYNEAIDWLNGEMTDTEAEKYCWTKTERDAQEAWKTMVMDDDIPF